MDNKISLLPNSAEVTPLDIMMILNRGLTAYTNVRITVDEFVEASRKLIFTKELNVLTTNAMISEFTNPVLSALTLEDPTKPNFQKIIMNKSGAPIQVDTEFYSLSIENNGSLTLIYTSAWTVTSSIGASTI